MPKHFESFAKLMEEEVLPHRKKHLDWICLGGPDEGGYPKVFATFKYRYRIWNIKSDTRMAKLLEAYNLEKGGEKPFVLSETSGGNLCLRLSSQTEEADGLFIYED